MAVNNYALKKESYKDDNHRYVGVSVYMNKNFHLYKYLGVLLLGQMVTGQLTLIMGVLFSKMAMTFCTSEDRV